MSGDVIAFPKPDDRVLLWACNCGCTVHHHHADGDVVCAECSNIASGLTGEWRERLPDDPEEAKPLDGDNFKVIDLANGKTFLRRALTHDDVDNIVAAAVIYQDGSTSTFSTEIDTDDRRSWLRRKLEEAFARITSRA